MKISITALFILVLMFGCKENEPTKTEEPKRFWGTIKLLDEAGNEQHDMSGIKITVLENQQVAHTDSLGGFLFSDLKLTGEINLKYEYKDYPSVYSQRIKFEEAGGINDGFNEILSISPTAAVEYTIETVESSTRTNGECFIGFHAKYKSPFSKLSFLILLNKKYDRLDYSSGKYISMDGRTEQYFHQLDPEDTLRISSWQYTISTLNQLGFATGDSIYVRLFPLTTTNYYFGDHWDGKKVFPSIGNGSNIVGSKIR